MTNLYIGKFKQYINSIYQPIVEAIKPKWVIAAHDDTEVAEAFTEALTNRIRSELGAFGMKFVTDAVNEAELTQLPGWQKYSHAVAAAEDDFKANGITGVSGTILAAAVQCAVIELQAAQALASQH